MHQKNHFQSLREVWVRWERKEERCLITQRMKQSFSEQAEMGIGEIFLYYDSGVIQVEGISGSRRFWGLSWRDPEIPWWCSQESSHLALAPCCFLAASLKEMEEVIPCILAVVQPQKRRNFSRCSALLCAAFKLQNTLLGPWVLCYVLGLFCLFSKLFSFLCLSLSFFLSFFFFFAVFLLMSPENLCLTFDLLLWASGQCGFLIHDASKDKNYH